MRETRGNFVHAALRRGFLAALSTVFLSGCQPSAHQQKSPFLTEWQAGVEEALEGAHKRHSVKFHLSATSAADYSTEMQRILGDTDVSQAANIPAARMKAFLVKGLEIQQLVEAIPSLNEGTVPAPDAVSESIPVRISRIYFSQDEGWIVCALSALMSSEGDSGWLCYLTYDNDVQQWKVVGLVNLWVS